MTLPNLILHPSAAIALDAYVAQPPHAAILSGPIGIGKTLLARAVSSELLGGGLDNNPYYRSVEPMKQTITIEQVRELIKFFRLSVPGANSIKRVAVIQDADLMGIEAQNALLKLLEEPPVGSALVLTSSNLLGLLPTIRSRIQSITLPAPAKVTIQQYYTERGYDANAVSRSVLRHGANIAAIQQMLDSADDTSDSTLDLVKQVLSGTSYQRLLLVDSMAKQKEQATVFVDTLSAVAMASLESASAKASGSLGRWQSVLEATNTAAAALQRSGNTKLVLTELMLEI